MTGSAWTRRVRDGRCVEKGLPRGGVWGGERAGFDRMGRLADDGKRLDSLSRAGRCLAIKKLIKKGGGLGEEGRGIGPDRGAGG